MNHNVLNVKLGHLVLFWFSIIYGYNSAMKLEHIGIAVEDLEKSNELFAKILGEEHYQIEDVISEMVSTSFFQVGDVKIELLVASDPESAISKFIKKRGEGIHHLAFSVDDIAVAMNDMKKKGIRLLNDEPKEGADNKLICFLHPKDTNGVLIEICQDKA